MRFSFAMSSAATSAEHWLGLHNCASSSSSSSWPISDELKPLPGVATEPHSARLHTVVADATAFLHSPASKSSVPLATSAAPPRTKRPFALEGVAAPTQLPGLVATRGRRGEAASFFLFGSNPEPKDIFKNNWSAKVWRMQHNYFLDRGMKFVINYKSPMIKGTDLFDLEKFGCFSQRGGQGLKIMRNVTKDQKDWWQHPNFKFNGKFARIGVHLQDLTTGEVRWDAIYDIVGQPHNLTQIYDESKYFPHNGDALLNEEKPVGGTHPFFQPDWCPAEGDFIAHKYKLTIKNLSQVDRPEQDIVGEMFFTQYNPSQLMNTYAYENAADPEGGSGGMF